MSVGHNLCTLIHSTCRYIYFCFYIHRVLHFLPHAAALPGPGPPLSSQWERAPVVIMASVCGVLRQPAEEEGGGGGGVGWGGLLLLHLAFLGWVSGLSSALFRGFPGSRARPQQ